MIIFVSLLPPELALGHWQFGAPDNDLTLGVCRANVGCDGLS